MQNENPRRSNTDVIKDAAATTADLTILQFFCCADRAFMICMRLNFPGETLRCLILVVSDCKQNRVVSSAMISIIYTGLAAKVMNNTDYRYPV